MAITPSISASRVNGISPLAIFFDATGTTSTNTADTFREVLYFWDFGDSGASGTSAFTYGWDTTRQKRYAWGPFVSHVFKTDSAENPDSPAADRTYTVTLYVYDGTDWASTTTTITLYDPWGSNGYTTCYVVNHTADSDFTWAPAAGAHFHCTVTQQNTNSWDTVLGYAATNRRVLVKGGATAYTNSGFKYMNTDGPWSFEGFNTGSGYPILQSTATTTGPIPIHSNASSGLDDGRFVGFRLDNNGQTAGRAIDREGGYTPANGIQELLLQNIVCISEFEGGFYPYQGIHVYLVDCYMWAHVFSMLAQGDATNSSAKALTTSSILGSYFRQDATTDVGGGNVRCGGFVKLQFSNNTIDGGCPGRQHIKFHTVPNGTAQYLVGSENKIIGGGVVGEAWPIDIAPTDTGASETVTLFIWENNWQVTGPFNERHIMVHASNGVVRNNFIDSSATDATGIVSRGIVVTSWGPGSGTADPNDVQVYNNTLYSSGTNTLTATDQGFWLVNVDITSAGATNILVTNNYGSAPNFSKTGTVYDPNAQATSTNNTVTNSPGWVTSNGVGSGTLTVPADFRLLTGSVAKDTGATKRVFIDFFGVFRPQNSIWDKGFAEFSIGTLFPWDSPSTPALFESEYSIMHPQTNQLMISKW